MLTLPSLHRYSSRKEWENACWQKLLKSTPLLKSLITSYERHNLVMRAAVKEGISLRKGFRELSRETGLSLQTISSIKKALSDEGYRSYRERGKTERKKKVYSSIKQIPKHRPSGRPMRTKYGTIYIP